MSNGPEDVSFVGQNGRNRFSKLTGIPFPFGPRFWALPTMIVPDTESLQEYLRLQLCPARIPGEVRCFVI